MVLEVTRVGDTVTLDASGIRYQELNECLRRLVADGIKKINLVNVCGQRYIGDGLEQPVEIDIQGTPGNDLGAFMNGPLISVHGNAQDCIGNTMNDGLIVVHGHAGDITGMAARGGKIFIRDYVGYRAGIHMKEYGEQKPSLVIGGTAQDFCGEYMAGGVLVLLGLGQGKDERHRVHFLGTGMHGGVIYLSGSVEPSQLGKEVAVAALEEADRSVLEKLVVEFAGYFGCDAAVILSHEFSKVYPRWLRPYGRLYAY